MLTFWTEQSRSAPLILCFEHSPGFLCDLLLTALMSSVFEVTDGDVIGSRPITNFPESTVGQAICLEPDDVSIINSRKTWVWAIRREISDIGM